MIAYLRGKIIYSGLGLIILETGGVGYKVNLSPVLNYKQGELAEFYIHEHLREDADDLYGFATYEELLLFEKLISVNGVGPKAAMSVMSMAPVQRIVSAIVGEDLSFFVSVPGVGKKVAAKIILDLKSKLSGSDGAGVIGKLDESTEIIDTLVSLGYVKPEINKVIAKMPEDLENVEEKIRWCLKNLSKQ